MPQRHLNPFRKRARQLLGRPVYVRVPAHHSAGLMAGGIGDSAGGDPSSGSAAANVYNRSMLAIAYTGVRRPCICTGCICLTPAERERQKRVFALVRAVMLADSSPPRRG